MSLNKVLTHYGFAPLEVMEDFSTAAKKFRDEDLIARIDLYIEENFFDTSRLEEQSKRGVKVFYTASHLGEPAEPPKTFEVIVRKLKDKLGMKGNLFSDYLFKLMKQKKMTESDICTRAHFGIINFSKLRLEKNYRPSKEIILAIAFVLKLNFKETNTLLERAGYFLANTYKEDVIAAYFFDNQIYDLSLINEVLDYYDCPILGD